MTDETLDTIAQALTSVPPRAVDPAVLSDADPDVLADALRRAVADLPAAEQRARLAAAFAAMTPARSETAAAQTETLEAELLGASPMPMHGGERPKISAATAGLLALRPFTAVKAGALAGVAVIALLAGILAGVVSADDTTEHVAVPAAAQQPIGVLQPVGHGDAPPSDEQVAAMLPPDPQAQIDAAEAAAAADPEVFEEDGLDPADAALVTDPGFDPYVSGYVDDPGGVAGPVPGDTADPDEPDSGVTPRPADGPGDSADASTEGTSGGTADGAGSSEGDAAAGGAGGVDSPGVPGGDSSGDDSDDGGLVDLCAGDLPPVECEGVGGTVTLAVVRPFAFIEDPIAYTTWPSCVGDTPDLANDEFVLHVATNNLATFDVRYRIAGSDDEFEELSAATDERWREVYDPETRVWTNTCMVATRPTQEATPLEVHITGVGDGDSGTATFDGVIDLDVAATGVLRQDRPPVRVDALSASQFDVTVPVGDEERAEVTLVQRDPTGEATCDPSLVVGEADQRILARSPDEITLNPGWRDTLFRLTVDDPGYFAICVLWTDTFTPPTEIERSIITLDVPDVTSTTFLYARYDQNACLGGGCPSTPLIAVAQATPVGGDTCHGRLYEGGYHPDSPIEMCTIPGIPSRLLLTTLSGFSKDGDYIRYDGEQGRVEANFDPTCAETTCTTWYSVPVRAPGGFFDGNGGIVGRALVGVRINGGSAGVAIGSEVPQSVDDATVEGPRLDWSAVRVRSDSHDPARSVIVEWAADRPVTMSVEAADSDYLDTSCPTVTKSTTSADTAGMVRLERLCPGTRHYISFHLTDEAGKSTLYNVLHRPFRGGVDYVQQSYPIQTETLDVVYDYRLEFAEYERGTRNEITGKGVIPTRLYLELPGHTAVDYQQLYYGEPYFGLDCADPGHFDQSGSGIRHELSGGTIGLPDAGFQLQTYRASARGLFDTFGHGDRVCPSPHIQFHHSPSVASLTCFFSLRNFAPTYDGGTKTNTIDHLLDGGEGRWVATVDSRCPDQTEITTMEATLTIRMRPA